MTYEMYRYVFLGGAIACAIMVIISVVLFFVLKIPTVIGDLTGRNAKKAIENIRKQNEASGDKTYQSSAVNLERGKLTDKISHSGRILTRDQSPFGTGIITEKIATQQLSAEETTLLTQQEETTLLPQQEEATLLSQQNETALLTPEMGQTEQLGQSGTAAEPVEKPFAVEFEITFIHTNEVIAQGAAL